CTRVSVGTVFSFDHW
nr:immunoglobulin heavy chain junction region [Macaca mulatta]